MSEKKKFGDTVWYDTLCSLYQKTQIPELRNVLWEQVKLLLYSRVRGFINEKKSGILKRDPDLCYDKDTQVVTKDGIKYLKDITVKDEILTLNKFGYVEYQHPTQTLKKYERTLLHFISQRIDLKVSKDQNLFISKKKSNKFSDFYFSKSKDINNKLLRIKEKFPCIYFVKKNGGMWKGSYSKLDKILYYFGLQNNQENRENFVKFMSWFLSEGCLGHGEQKKGFSKRLFPSISYENIGKKIVVNKDVVRQILGGYYGNTKEFFSSGEKTATSKLKRKVERKAKLLGFSMVSRPKVNNDYGISICQQKDEDKRNEIYKLVRDLGFSRYMYKWGIWFWDKKMFNFLLQFGHSEKRFVPEFIKDLPSNCLNLFLETYSKGDGSRGKDGRISIVTSSDKMKDDLVEILLKTEGGFSIYKETGGWKVFPDKNKCLSKLYECHPTWVVQICFKKKERAYLRKAKKVDYNDYVYDVSVPNRVIYVIRNGKGCWSSNCQQLYQEVFFIFQKACDIWDPLRKTKFLTFLGDIVDQDILNIIRLNLYHKTRDNKIRTKLNAEFELPLYTIDDFEKEELLNEMKHLFENFQFDTVLERDIVNTTIYGKSGDWSRLQRKSKKSITEFSKIRTKVMDKLKKYVVENCTLQMKEILQNVLEEK